MRCKTYKMEETLESIIDYRGKTPRKSDDGILTLSAKSVRDGYIDYSQCYYISEDEYNRFMVRGFPQIGDVLMTTEAPLGVTARLDRDDVALAQRLLTLRGKKEILDTGYLYYYLRSPTGQAKLHERQTGTTVSGIKQAEFRKIEIDLPDIDKQQRIVSILGDLDDKIKTNTEINENLLQQAEVIFKDKFLSNYILPEGWKTLTLGDVSDMTAGGDKPKIISDLKTEECQYPIYSNGINDEGLYGFTNDYKIIEESVTVSARGTIGYVCLRHTPFTPIVRLVTLIPHKGIISAKYLYLWLKNIQIHGTGTTQQQLTIPDFRKTEIVIPSEKSMKQFTETIDPLFQQIWTNQEQNTKLANIRDALLPKLMSGELDVSELDL